MTDKIHQLHATRLSEAGLHAELYAQIAKPTGQLKLPFQTYEEKVYYVFYILEHLLEATLKTAGAGGLTLNEIKDLFQQEYERIEQTALTEKQAADSVRWILIKVLKNDTQEISFSPSGLQESFQKHWIDFIKFPQIEKNGRLITVYQVGMDGIRLMFSYKEISDNMRISYAGLLLKQQVENGEYEGAQQSLYETIQNLQYIQTSINMKCDSMRSNVLTIRQTETKDVYSQTIDAVKKAMITYKEVQNIADAQMQQVIEQERSSNIEINPELQAKLDQLESVIEKLRDTLVEMSRTINIYDHYCMIRRQAQLSQLMISTRRGATIKKNILKPLMQDPHALEWLDLLLERLFLRKPKKHLNPCRLLEFPLSRQTEDLPDPAEDPDEEEQESEEELLQREKHKHILKHQLFASTELMSALHHRPSHSITLQEFIEQSSELPLIDDLNGCKEFFTLWCNLNNTSFENIEKQQQVIFDSDFTQFEPIHVIASYVEQNPSLHSFEGLILRPAPGQAFLTVPNQGTLQSTNIQFLLIPKQL